MFHRPLSRSPRFSSLSFHHPLFHSLRQRLDVAVATSEAQSSHDEVETLHSTQARTVFCTSGSAVVAALPWQHSHGIIGILDYTVTSATSAMLGPTQVVALFEKSDLTDIPTKPLFSTVALKSCFGPLTDS